MKKIIGCLVIALAFISVSSALAQTGNQDRRAKMQQVMRQKIKDSLQISDAMADSVMAVRREFQPKQREIFMDSTLTADQKKAQFEEMKPQITARYKAIGLTDEQISKLEEMEQRMRARVRDRVSEKNG